MKSKTLIAIAVCAVLVFFPSLLYSADRVTDEDAVKMVEMAGKMIEEMGDDALAVISYPLGPCCDRERDLYVFVYDKDGVMLAHTMRPDIIGVSFKGNPGGNNVSDVIVEKAMKEGSGWIDYPYVKPGSGQIGTKHTYGKLFRHADKNYVVCCGVYK